MLFGNYILASKMFVEKKLVALKAICVLTLRLQHVEGYRHSRHQDQCSRTAHGIIAGQEIPVRRVLSVTGVQQR